MGLSQTQTALAVRPESGIAFNYNGTDITVDAEGMVCLNHMWAASGAAANKDPRQWKRLASTEEFAAELATSLNVEISHVWKSKRGKHNGGTWSHWQVAMAYAKYLSPEFHRYVNEVFRRWKEEERNPALKAERAFAAYQRKGKPDEWIERRFRGIGNRKELTSTMADHNCKVRGKNDNPFAEATRSISLSVIGKTPKEIKADKGLAKSARTRDHLEIDELVSIEWAEIQARKLIVTERADGNAECVEACRRAGRAVRLALESLQPANN